MALVALLILVLTLTAPAAVRADTAPQLPKLEAESPPPPAAPDAGGARALPRTVTVCQDQAARRCWLAETDRDCPGALAGGVFRAVPRGADADEALVRCRAQFEKRN
jgi:hypothetical protein